MIQRRADGLAGLLLLASTNFLFPTQKTVWAQEPAQEQKQVQDVKALEEKLTKQPNNADILYQIASAHYSAGNQAKAQDYFNKGVALDMQKKTCDEILAGAPVEFVKYNEKTKTNNFDELVFQEHLPIEKRMPVLAMFYVNDTTRLNQPIDKSNTSKREAVLFKELSKQYQNRIKFVCFEVDIDPALSKNEYAKQTQKFGITAAPSIALYAFNDIKLKEKGKTKIKQIDIVSGGPKEDRFIFPAFLNMSEYWIAGNVFGSDNPENDGKLYRFNNDWKIKAVASLKN